MNREEFKAFKSVPETEKFFDHLEKIKSELVELLKEEVPANAEINKVAMRTVSLTTAINQLDDIIQLKVEDFNE